MRPADPQLIESLTAEYVLGTLRGPARLRLERWGRELPEVGRAVRRWENRLAPLVLARPPIKPSFHIWTDIGRRVNSVAPVGAISARIHRGRRYRVAAAVLLISLTVALWWAHRPESPTAVANVTASDGRLLWRLTVNDTGDTLRVWVMGPDAHGVNQDFELWALPVNGVPISLGLLPTHGEVTYRLNARQREALQAAAKVAVSLEPSGGSRTGRPTGPVVHVAELRSSG